MQPSQFLEYQANDMFAVIVACCFLAHAWNADRSIRLEDWYKELQWGETSITRVKDLNNLVWDIFAKRRKFMLRANTDEIRKYVRRLCAALAPIVLPRPPAVLPDLLPDSGWAL